MKKVFLTLLAIYLIVMAYFAAFNWQMFTVFLNINLGFTLIYLPIIIVLFLFGLLFLATFWGFINISYLKIERDMVKKDNEIVNLKASQYDTQKQKVYDNAMSLKEVHGKLNKVLAKLKIENDNLTKNPDQVDQEETSITPGQQEYQQNR